MASSRDLPGLGCSSGVRLLIAAPDVCHKCLRIEIFSSEVLYSTPPHVNLKLEVDGLKGRGTRRLPEVMVALWVSPALLDKRAGYLRSLPALPHQDITVSTSLSLFSYQVSAQISSTL